MCDKCREHLKKTEPLIQERVVMLNAMIRELRETTTSETLRVGVSVLMPQLAEGIDLAKLSLGIHEVSTNGMSERDIGFQREDRFFKLVAMWSLIRDAIEIETITAPTRKRKTGEA